MRELRRALRHCSDGGHAPLVTIRFRPKPYPHSTAIARERRDNQPGRRLGESVCRTFFLEGLRVLFLVSFSMETMRVSACFGWRASSRASRIFPSNSPVATPQAARASSITAAMRVSHIERGCFGYAVDHGFQRGGDGFLQARFEIHRRGRVGFFGRETDRALDVDFFKCGGEDGLAWLGCVHRVGGRRGGLGRGCCAGCSESSGGFLFCVGGVLQLTALHRRDAETNPAAETASPRCCPKPRAPIRSRIVRADFSGAAPTGRVL